MPRIHRVHTTDACSKHNCCTDAAAEVYRALALARTGDHSPDRQRQPVLPPIGRHAGGDRAGAPHRAPRDHLTEGKSDFVGDLLDVVAMQLAVLPARRQADGRSQDRGGVPRPMRRQRFDRRRAMQLVVVRERHDAHVATTDLALDRALSGDGTRLRGDGAVVRISPGKRAQRSERECANAITRRSTGRTRRRGLARFPAHCGPRSDSAPA